MKSIEFICNETCIRLFIIAIWMMRLNFTKLYTSDMLYWNNLFCHNKTLSPVFLAAFSDLQVVLSSHSSDWAGMYNRRLPK